MNSLDKKLPEKEYNTACPTVRKSHSFFWNSKLTFERMCNISDWIGTLNKEQREMLEDLLTDAREII